MEIVCRTCLGSLEVNIDLFDPTCKYQLQILERVLDLQLFVEGEQFIICQQCRGKINSISEFQSSCRRSLQQLRNVYCCKTEHGDDEISSSSPTQVQQIIKVESQSTVLLSIRVDGNNSDASTDNYIPKERGETRKSIVATRSSKIETRNLRVKTLLSNRRKEEGEEDDKVTSNGKNSENGRINKNAKERKRKKDKPQTGLCKERIRRLRLQQYTADEVLEAIEDCRSYLNDIKCKQCIFCDYIGADAAILQLHFGRKHKNEFAKWCKYCNVVTTNLQEHKDTVKCYERKCKFCGDTFTQIKYLKQHLQLHCRTKLFQPAIDKLERRSSKDEPKWKSYDQYTEREVLQAIADSSAYMNELKNRSCLYCDFIASTSKILSVHLKSKHKEEFKNWCCRCNSSGDDLQLHINTTKCTEVRCVFCKKIFLKLNNLTTHLKLHCRVPPSDVEGKELSQDPKTLQCQEVDPFVLCTLCNKRVRHIRRHTAQKHKPPFDSDAPKNPGDALRKRLCPICGKTFMVSYLAAHMYTHTGKMPYKCSYCGKGFAFISILRTHERRHNGEKPFVCHVCGKGFVTSGEHKTHVQVHEGGPVQCTVCNKEFSRPGVLKLHMRRHTGENKFCCVDCGISFHRKSLLLNHLRRHKNERPFKCSFCEKDFTETSTLKKHERIHKGIKPYKCSICSFSCTQSHGLSLHMKQHPEDAPQADRPYKCFFCYRQFNTNAMLMSHTDIHHKEETLKNNTEKKVT